MAKALLLQSLEKFLDQPEGECWAWTHARNNTGYGCVWHNGKSTFAHRVFYELYRDPIPDGLDVDHLCRNRACCNPAHLDLVTRSINNRRGTRRFATTHCPQGHPYAGENLARHHRPSGITQRICRTCARAAHAESENRMRADPARRAYRTEYLRLWYLKKKERQWPTQS